MSASSSVKTPDPPRRIGVLGGMGPEATAHFLLRVAMLTDADDDVDHVPIIADSNTGVPSRIKALIDGTGENPAPVLELMAQKLVGYGATALAMPCNTAHAFASQIRASVSVPFIDMIEAASAEAAMAVPSSPVGLLASPAVRTTRLFDEALEKLGCRLIYPADDAALLSAIRKIKRNGRDPDARSILADEANALREAGAQAIILGCTEFSLNADAVGTAVIVVDTIDALARATIGFAGAKLKSPL